MSSRARSLASCNDILSVIASSFSSVLTRIAAVVTVVMLISLPAGVKESEKPAKANVATQCQGEYSVNRSPG